MPWASTVLYGAVALAGGYAQVVNLGHSRPALFYGGLAALFALDAVERRRWPAATPPVPAAALLLARTALFAVVAAGDGAGLSWALFALLPFTAYFAFGRLVSVGLGLALLAVTAARFQFTQPGWYRDREHLTDVLMFALGVVLTIAMAAVAAEERRVRVRLEESNTRLRAYAERVADLSATAERNRLARDIHDSLGHHLTAISVLLEKAAAFRERDPAAADRAVADAHGSARRALDDVRQSVRALRVEAPAFDLVTALGDLVRGADDGLLVTLDVAGDPAGYGGPALTALYRAAQEGITNARRHAAATRVSVRLAMEEAAARLVVADDGRGFRPGRDGLGLVGMRERVELVGGSVEIDSPTGSGTTLTVTVPRGSP